MSSSLYSLSNTNILSESNKTEEVANIWQDLFVEDFDKEKSVERAAFRDVSLFLVDARKEMFEINTENKCFFTDIVEGFLTFVVDKIIAAPGDFIGFAVFGLENSKDEIRIQIPVAQPSANLVTSMEEWLSREKAIEDLNPVQSEINLSEVLWKCQGQLSKIKTNIATQKIYMFTFDDNPVNNDTRNQSLQKFEDMNDAKISIEVFTSRMSRNGQLFNPNLFWNSVLAKNNPQEEKNFLLHVASDDSFENLSSSVRKRTHRKRTHSRLILNIAPNVDISVGLYALVLEAKKGTHQWVDAQTNSTVYSKQESIDDTGETLSPEEIRRFYKYGGKKVYFNQDDMIAIKSLYSPGLECLGFKPKSDAIKVEYMMNRSTFCYPLEKPISGSIVLFSAFLKKMLEKDVVMICRMVTRTGMAAKLVALLPQEEVNDPDDDSRQLVPPGFNIIPLPFADDIRDLDFQETEEDLILEPTDEQLNSAKSLVKSIRFKYDPNNFDNPALEQHYNDLQSVALKRDREFVSDNTLPDELIDTNEKLKSKIEEFKALTMDNYIPVTKKKRASSSKTSSSSKKVHLSEILPSYSVDSMRESLNEGKLKKLKVNELKLFLKSQNIQFPSKSNKAALLKLVEDFLTLN